MLVDYSIFLLLFLPFVFILVLKELGKCILVSIGGFWVLGVIYSYGMESMNTGLSPNAQGHFQIRLGRVLVVVAAQGRNTFVSFNFLGQQHVVHPCKTNLTGSLPSS